MDRVRESLWVSLDDLLARAFSTTKEGAKLGTHQVSSSLDFGDRRSLPLRDGVSDKVLRLGGSKRTNQFRVL